VSFGTRLSEAMRGRWLPGMAEWEGRRFIGNCDDRELWIESATSLSGVRVVECLRDVPMEPSLYYHPDLSDPCTIGGLERVARKAWAWRSLDMQAFIDGLDDIAPGEKWAYVLLAGLESS
tara:strand:- start:339 stop:698 length:360 start_codon:yes stop_codon:yes gene_type:complete